MSTSNMTAAAGVPPSSKEAAFYIPAIGPAARPRRTLKHNDTFAVFDSHGDIGATAGGADGLFDCDTRYLSHLELLVNGTQPLLLGSVIQDDNLNYYVDLTNPDIYSDGRIALLKDTVHVARTMYLKDGSLRERLALTNHGPEDIQITLSLTFASDFADVFEVRGTRRERRGRVWSEILGRGGVALCYRGLDEALRETTLSFEPAPTLLLESIANYVVRLASGRKHTIFVSACSRGRLRQSTVSFFKGLMQARRELKVRTRDVATIETSNRVLNEVLCRSLADLYMLVTATPEGPYPYAGIPWYSTTFGRDGIITALQMLWIDPSIAVGVLKRLARYQARSKNLKADSDPGKILHEMRGGEMAALKEVPFGLYYGSVDATPLFVILAGTYAERTGDYALIRELWPAIEQALAWIDGPGDSDGDGFVEYDRGAESGLSNQGWKDSQDAIFHADGRLAEGPIALVEVQAYVYAAKRLASRCACVLGMHERANQLQLQAEDLRARFDRAFWCEQIGTYAIALDGAKKRCEVRTSNAGHALFGGIAPTQRGWSVARCLLEAPFFSGWGIRTVAVGERRYNPMSYHNGSVWPHDNSLIAKGLADYGHKRGIDHVFEGLIRATSYMEHRRIPELFCGFRRHDGRGPTLYPVACSPQAWAAATLFYLLQVMLGLEFDPAARKIIFRNPRVPAFAGDVRIRNLRLGNAAADIALHHDGDSISLKVLRTSGDLQVAMVFDANASDAANA